jgi:hypothetical protein
MLITTLTWQAGLCFILCLKGDAKTNGYGLFGYKLNLLITTSRRLAGAD